MHRRPSKFGKPFFNQIEIDCVPRNDEGIDSGETRSTNFAVLLKSKCTTKGEMTFIDLGNFLDLKEDVLAQRTSLASEACVST